MLEYLVVLLDDLSVAYCHADNPHTRFQRMPLKTLKDTIRFGMRHNLMLQFILPPYKLDNEYFDLMETIDHVKIGSEESSCKLDVCVYDYIPSQSEYDNIVVRLPISEFIDNPKRIIHLLGKVKRLTINFKGIPLDFDDSKIGSYQKALELIANEVVAQNQKGNFVDVNILTDRIALLEMNNCDPGISNITVAPNGDFYLCPAFYYDNKLNIGYHSNSIGNISHGVNIPNKHLLMLSHAPICRKCNAYHCHRCIWQNSRLTFEVNTPSHQQCVISNIEHNISCIMNNSYKEIENSNNETLIPSTELDPFYSLINSSTI